MGNLLVRPTAPSSPPPLQIQPRLYADGSKVHSITSESSIHIQFVNSTPLEIECIWLDYKGNEVRYHQIHPGHAVWQQTFHTHPWTFKAVEAPDATPFLIVRNTQKQVLFPARDQDVYHIDLAPFKTWQPNFHRSHFKEFALFQAQVKTLLTAHHRLNKLVPSGAGNDALRVHSGHGVQHDRVRRSDAGTNTDAPPPPAGLQDLPLDVLLLVIQHMAPPVPDVLPVEQADICLPSDPRLRRMHFTAQQQLLQLGAYD